MPFQGFNRNKKNKKTSDSLYKDRIEGISFNNV